MNTHGQRRWKVSNTLCDMQISVGETQLHVAVDAGKYESYSCQLDDYLVEQARDTEISLRELVRRNAGQIVADEVAEEVQRRLTGLAQP